MSDQPYIRLATPDDAAALQALLTRLLDAYVLLGQDAAGVATLSTFASFDRIVARMQAGLRHHVAEHAGTLVGICALRDDGHLVMLFVDTPFQRRGLARCLWQAALADVLMRSDPARITVNASSFAVPVYERLGFVRLGELEVRDGVRLAPMEFRRR